MLSWLLKNKLVAVGGLLLVALLAGTTIFGVYQYKTNRSEAAHLSSLEAQVATLASALQSSSAVSETTKQELQEIANRGSVIAKSQDDLLTAAVAKTSPAVVSIVISKDVPKLQVTYVNPFGNDPRFDTGYRIPVYKQVGTQKQEVGAGTGFILRQDGYILTNRHVVSDDQADYTVLLSSGTQKTARVVYRDPDNDLAIIKIDGSGYPTAELGQSASLQLGQTVVAIGNALGEYNNSVSVGIISGLNRTIQARDNGTSQTEELKGVIQTDAAINPGNSGGPLLDLQGKVVGINVAVSGGNNIAFAIPVDEFKAIVQKVLS